MKRVLSRPPAEGAGEPPPSSWFPSAYFLSLVAFWVLQTLARLYFYRTAWSIGRPALLLHVLTIAALVVVVLLILAAMTSSPRLRRAAPLLSVLLLGLLHAFLTLFDLLQAACYFFAGIPAPFSLLFHEPHLLLSLLDNIDIGASVVAIVLSLALVLHMALYVPVRHEIPRLARRLLSRPLGFGRARLRAAPTLAACVLAVSLLHFFAPLSFRRGEPFHFGSARMFQMAPESLMEAPPRDIAPARPAQPPPPGSRPLVLIVVDALRRDRMGVYVPALDNTPFLSRLERQGRLRRYDAYSTCTFSFCGIMSLLASRSWNNFGRRPDTIIDHLTDRSYRSYLILGGKHGNFGTLTRLYGRGVTSAIDQPAGTRSDDLFVLRQLRETRFPDPQHSFLYLHLVSTHSGSFLHQPFRGDMEEGGLMSLFRMSNKPNYRFEYDRRIRQADEVIRRIFSVLQEKGLLERALVIITADHGERLGDRGVLFHGGAADGPTLTIPMLVYDATGQTYPDRPLASQIDVAPTFLAGIGMPIPAGWRGRPLQDDVERPAVPVGTWEATGAVVRHGAADFLYLCRRNSGRESVQRLAGSRPEASPDPPLAVLRARHRTVAAPVEEATCRR